MALTKNQASGAGPDSDDGDKGGRGVPATAANSPTPHPLEYKPAQFDLEAELPFP